ncbi:hypothetical protein [Cohnella sp. JJ-181]|uniref:hypothetical protein n=1 Tax=Cohnella rhizoplanae TaxID=2974897 RepID=UPI0022FF92E9|nr:hypothetical protein [Cohnella sp. JJ-181]CAI6075827.1 hypothetical protein COHCIP112018_02493 [Cohnella sp. JJ-181]
MHFKARETRIAADAAAVIAASGLCLGALLTLLPLGAPTESLADDGGVTAALIAMLLLAAGAYVPGSMLSRLAGTVRRRGLYLLLLSACYGCFAVPDWWPGLVLMYACAAAGAAAVFADTLHRRRHAAAHAFILASAAACLPISLSLIGVADTWLRAFAILPLLILWGAEVLTDSAAQKEVGND